MVVNEKQDTHILFEGPEWDFKKISTVYSAIEDIAINELGLDVYPNQIEIITSEQMLDGYASSGLPLMYRHWSFGKRFAHEELLYRKGLQGLAYEIVINSNPCIVYIMEENSMTMQTLVLAHAAFGHNHFFKNNYLFRQWTDADGLLDYLAFARDFVSRCEEQHGLDAVERIIDAGHALMNHGVNRYARRPHPNLREEHERREARLRHQQSHFRDLWRTLPDAASEPELAEKTSKQERQQALRNRMQLPEENLLYFLEKHAPLLEEWQRELLRIIRNISQYMYPQKQTKLMNEGCASFVHYTIVNRLYERGLIHEGAMMEFLHSHTSVIFQPDFDDRRYSGINPYALGFAMMRDIARACTQPDDEDRHWFPEIAGNQDPFGTLRHAWENYRDESFILQFLSPKIIREFRLFRLIDDSEEDHYYVSAIHDERGYREIREALARHYDLARREPDIEINDVDLLGDRILTLNHKVMDDVVLDLPSTRLVLHYLAELWGFPVQLHETDSATDKIIRTHSSQHS